MAIRSYSIGRRPDNDIVVDHESVSRRHAELTLTDDGRCYLTDCASSGGTQVMRKGAWEPVQQTFVQRGERLRLGDCELDVEGLLARLPPRENSSPPLSRPDVSHSEQGAKADASPLGVPVRRDPETGEILPNQ